MSESVLPIFSFFLSFFIVKSLKKNWNLLYINNTFCCKMIYFEAHSISYFSNLHKKRNSCKVNSPSKRFFCRGSCFVQLLSCVQLFVNPWTAARQASLSITNSQSLLKLMSIELVMPSNYLILCHPFLLLPSVFPSITVFSNESVLLIRWPKY